MERVAFLVEDDGRRLGCLLNPENVELRRWAGLRRRESTGGSVTRAGSSDDPLTCTGGGLTELKLDLLFDVSLAGSTVQSDDVRELTRPLWELAENRAGRDGFGRPPIVRFVWGKSWNIPGVVAAVAERLEAFSPEGIPRRSWLRMRMLRVPEPEHLNSGRRERRRPASQQRDRVPREPGSAATEGERTEIFMADDRLDLIAERHYGSASLWRLLADANDIEDPTQIPPGTVLRIPALSGREGQT